MAIVPDTKDWTWVLERPCDECGFDASGVDVARAGQEAQAMVSRWRNALARPDARIRPDDQTWSVSEYGCHARDMLFLFASRLRLVRTEDVPVLGDCDQDEIARDDRYDLQVPAEIGDQIAHAARSFSEEVAAVEDWGRRGRRMPWTFFTADSLTRYVLHDLVHHLHDVAA